MKSLVFLFYLISMSMLSAQPSIHWQKTFGGSNADQARSIRQTRDGGYIVTGTTASNNGDVFGNHGSVDFWVLKLDSIGGIEWKKTYGGSSAEQPYSIRQTSDGGYVVAGYTHSNNWDVSGNHGYYDAWLLKLNSDGDIQWQKCLGGSSWEDASDVEQTSDGGYILVGRSQSIDGDVSVNQGGLDYWIIKLDSDGILQWQKSYGGNMDDIAYAVKQTADGGYIVAGESSSNNGNVSGNHGSSDYWVLKLNYEGKIEWQKSLGGTSIDRANDILQSEDGGYVVFGQTSSFNGDVTGHHGGYDFWVVNLSLSGDLEWQKALGGSNFDFGRSIHRTQDGGYVMTGQTQSMDGDAVGNVGGADLWVIKINESGGFLWQKSFGGSMGELGHSIQQTNDGGYIVAGEAWSTDGDLTENKGSSDFWVVKLAPESTPTSTPITQIVNIYPNPASQTITLRLPFSPAEGSKEAGDAPFLTLCITDVLGRELSLQTIMNSELVDISNLPDGFYFLSATTTSGARYVGKFRKQD
jgi:hypothetical protein